MTIIPKLRLYINKVNEIEYLRNGLMIELDQVELCDNDIDYLLDYIDLSDRIKLPSADEIYDYFTPKNGEINIIVEDMLDYIKDNMEIK